MTNMPDDRICLNMIGEVQKWLFIAKFRTCVLGMHKIELFLFLPFFSGPMHESEKGAI